MAAANEQERDTKIPVGFAQELIAWQRVAGRHGLPWQGHRDPYRVWLSEVMLQQTQVATVIARYTAFLQRFPSVQELAAAHEDEVLALWQGMGYYSRARNLHRCAQQVAGRPGAEFPGSSHELEQLPGIGPSTAAAIAAFCFDEQISIFDGNVQRVLARVTAFSGDLSSGKEMARLRSLAQVAVAQVRDRADMPTYTQALMDLGATVCLSKQPLCAQCPTQACCKARQHGDPSQLPIKTKRTLRKAEAWLVWLDVRPFASGWQIRLQRRPDRGIWAGLYAPPMEPTVMDASPPDAGAPLPVLKHVLTHRDLYLYPVLRFAKEAESRARLANDADWYDLNALSALGLPTAIHKILKDLKAVLPATSASV